MRLALVPVSIFEEASVRPKIDAYLRDLTKMQQETAAKLKDVNSTLSVQRYMTDQTKHPEPEYLKNLEQSKQLSSELTASTGGLRLLNTLSNPVETITTNSDGRFAIKNLRNRNYILVAKSDRTVGSSEELYYWIVTVNPSKLTGKQVLLSNNNVFSKVPDANILVQYQ